MKRKRPIPIGVEFYKQMIEDGYYYIDKTLLIRDIIEQGNTVTLFTRPRRFGKTLTQSMLKTFFEKEILPDGTIKDNSVYFQGKKIMEAGEEYTKHMGQYPVIFLSLKSAKQPTYEMAYKVLNQSISKEFIRHRYILDSEVLLPVQKARFNLFIEELSFVSYIFKIILILLYFIAEFNSSLILIVSALVAFAYSASE